MKALLETIICCLVAAQFCLTQDYAGQSSIKQFFATMQQRPSDSAVPGWDKFDKMEPALASASSAEINEALPPIFASAADPDLTVRSFAGAALISISLRQDGADLLKQYVPRISDLLNSFDPRLQTTAIFVLTSMRPAPPTEVVFPIILDFVKRKDRDEAAQIAAIGSMLRMRPDTDSAIEAIEQFTARPLLPDARINVLQAIRISNTRDPRLSDLAIRSMSDKHPGVKVAAIAVIYRMGPVEVAKAEPVLRKLEKDRQESREVNLAAANALKALLK